MSDSDTPNDPSPQQAVPVAATDSDTPTEQSAQPAASDTGDAETAADPAPLPVLRRLEHARALPEVDGDGHEPYVKPEHDCIESFIDVDGRVMRVVVTVDGLAKTEVNHG